jgi:hypothetical protein
LTLTAKRLPDSALQILRKGQRIYQDPEVPHRYNAACAAALAGCGHGKVAVKLDNNERGRLRDQALNWLRADLAAWGRLLMTAPDKLGPINQQLRHSLVDPDYAGVRGLDALAKLPETECKPCQTLWDDVANTLARSQADTLMEMEPVEGLRQLLAR